MTVPGGVGRPLMVIVSRLTEQKGLPLMLHGIKVRVQCINMPWAQADVRRRYFECRRDRLVLQQECHGWFAANVAQPVRSAIVPAHCA